MAQVVLADEINRATPKTQSALLECMEERQATVDGTTHMMPEPFMVIGTQNPIEYEGTFALPEAQFDRFMLRLQLGYPQPLEEIMILDEQKRSHPIEELDEVASTEELRAMQAGVREIYIDSAVSDYIVRLVNSTRSHPDVYLGASPRGSLALYRAGQAYAALSGRDYVIPDDIKMLAVPALAHRLIVKTAATVRDVDAVLIVRGAAGNRAHRKPLGSGIRASDGQASLARPRTAQMLRRIQVLVLAGVLLIAALSTGAPFLFFLVYLSILVVGGSYVVTRFGLADLEAGYVLDRVHAQAGDILRASYTVRNTAGCRSSGSRFTTPRACPCHCPARRSRSGRAANGRGRSACR